MFKFSDKSKKILNTVDERLLYLANEVIKISPIQFEIIEGWRSEERQQELYKEGKSRCDGIIKKSKHQEGKAIDFVCYNPNTNRITWDKQYYIEVAKLFKEKAKELGIAIRWGGDFVGFFDGPHIELV